MISSPLVAVEILIRLGPLPLADWFANPGSAPHESHVSYKLQVTNPGSSPHESHPLWSARRCVPARHCAHDDDPASEYVPVSQAVARLVPSHQEPAGHTPQDRLRCGRGGGKSSVVVT